MSVGADTATPEVVGNFADDPAEGVPAGAVAGAGTISVTAVLLTGAGVERAVLAAAGAVATAVLEVAGTWTAWELVGTWDEEHAANPVVNSTARKSFLIIGK